MTTGNGAASTASASQTLGQLISALAQELPDTKLLMRIVDRVPAGVAIVRRALQAPIRQISENAGVEGSIVVGKVLDARGSNFGYDAQNDERRS